MPFSDIYKPSGLAITYELFPPKTESGAEALFHHVEQLLPFQPSCITWTYGAGGTTQQQTLEIISSVKERFGVPVASHLTCVGATEEELRGYLQKAQNAQIEGIVALRGDPPKGEKEFKVTKGGLAYANELVTLIREEFPDFQIAVAGYPEKHQEAPSLEVDLLNLKRKVDAGADVVLTQLFYENQTFESFRREYEKAGITKPLVPGILPITSFSQIKRITALCGAILPQGLSNQLADRENDPEGQFEIGVEFATRQVEELVEMGVPGIHFYVLNKSQATCQVLRNLNIVGSTCS